VAAILIDSNVHPACPACPGVPWGVPWDLQFSLGWNDIGFVSGQGFSRAALSLGT
jgi:hypothetical protein